MVVTLIVKSLNDSIKFPIISGVIGFGITQLLTKIGQGSFSLGENRFNANATSIIFNFKK